MRMGAVAELALQMEEGRSNAARAAANPATSLAA